jgi:hypothetical protein
MNRRFLIIDILKITLGFSLLCAIPVYLTAMASQRDNRFTLSLSDLSFAYALKQGNINYWDIPRLVAKELTFDKLDMHAHFLEQYQGKGYGMESLKDSLEKYRVKINYLYVDPFKAHQAGSKAGDPVLMYCYKWLNVASVLNCEEVILHFPEAYFSKPQFHMHLKELFTYAEENRLNLKMMVSDGFSDNEGLKSLDASMKHHVTIAEKGKSPDLPNICGEAPCGKFTLVAKTYAFHQDTGYETSIDYQTFMEQLAQSRQPVNISIEYCGTNFSDFEGLHQSKQLFLSLKQQYI